MFIDLLLFSLFLGTHTFYMTQSPLYNTAIFKTHRAFDALMSESICEDGLEQPTIRMNLASCLFQNKEKMELDSPVVHVGRTSNTCIE